MLNTIQKPRYTNNDTLLLVLVFILALFVMITRNMFINNAYIMSDEYNYKELAKYTFDDLSTLPTRGAVNIVYPSFLYLRIFYFTSYFQERFFEAAQILNSLFFCLALFPIYGLAHIFVKPQVALLIGICSLISPYGSYTAHFMPESMYYFLFWLFVYSFLSLIGQRPGTAGLISGVIMGLLFLTKPHAIMILIATNLVSGSSTSGND